MAFQECCDIVTRVCVPAYLLLAPLLCLQALQEGQTSADATTARRVAFTGLSLTLEAGTPLLSPLDGEAELTVSWPLHHLPGHAPPRVSLSVRLEALQLQLCPLSAAGLLVLGRGFADAHSRAVAVQEQQQKQQGPSGLEAPAQQQQLLAPVLLASSLPAGHHSFIQDLMLPECSEALVQDALLESATAASGITGQVGGQRGSGAQGSVGALRPIQSA